MGDARQQPDSPSVLMLLTNAYEPDPRVRQEALALSSMGCSVRLLAWDRDCKFQARECIEGIEVERVFLRSRHGRGTTQIFFYAWLYLKMLWHGWRTRFDAVHCHDLDTLPLGFILGKIKRKPIIYDAHESFPDMLTGSVPAAVRHALTGLETFFIRRIDLLITVGEKLRCYFATRGAAHSVVVGNWKRTADFHRSTEERAAIRRRLGIPEDALAVVCITNLLPDRKLEPLLEAVDALQNVYAIIGGRGALQAMVEQRAAGNPRILYTGFARARDIADFTCAADVVYYGFDDQNPNAQFSAPNKLFEAIAAGRPLITGDFGEIADVVRRFSCGVVLPEYTAAEICKALSTLQDRHARTVAGANACDAGATMNWDSAEKVLHHEYSSLLGQQLKAPPFVPEEVFQTRGAASA